MGTSPLRHLFRVRFIDPVDKQPIEVVVESVSPSSLFGLVALHGFVFNDHKKMVIRPDEDAARKRFGKTETLHIPYHHLVYVEEFDEEPTDIKNLPFLHPVDALKVEPDDPRGH